MKYINFDKTGVYKKLAKQAEKAFLFKDKLDSKRVGGVPCPYGGGT